MTRFHELPVGAAFEYQGRVHVKTGPLTASERSGGGQRCIPRSAAVRPADASAPPPHTETHPDFDLDEAVESFCRTVTEMFDELLAEDPEQRGFYRGRLEQARREFLKRLKRRQEE